MHTFVGEDGSRWMMTTRELCLWLNKPNTRILSATMRELTVTDASERIFRIVL